MDDGGLQWAKLWLTARGSPLSEAETADHMGHRQNQEVADVLKLEQRSHSVRFLELKKDLQKTLPVRVTLGRWPLWGQCRSKSGVRLPWWPGG